jgi:hypothetical protein
MWRSTPRTSSTLVSAGQGVETDGEEMAAFGAVVWLPCLSVPPMTHCHNDPLPATGGAPDVATLTRGKFSSGITGCIKNLVLHTARPGAPPPQPLDLQHRAQAGANTRPCPS